MTTALDPIRARRGVPVQAHLRRAVAGGRKLLVPYITGGITADWASYLQLYVDAGADAIEIGLPFSDPIVDGSVVQEASHRSLQNGTTVAGLLRELAEINLPVPLIAMTYSNLIVHAGPESFCTALAGAGIRGLLVPDLPVDELAASTSGPASAGETGLGRLADQAAAAGVDLSLLAAPSTSAARQTEIVTRSRGFVYAVAVMGTTGVRAEVAQVGIELAGRLKAETDLPVLLGFGISTPEHAVAAARVADGVVVGAMLMRLILDGAPAAAVAGRVAQLRLALDGVTG